MAWKYKCISLKSMTNSDREDVLNEHWDWELLTIDQSIAYLRKELGIWDTFVTIVYKDDNNDS